MIRKIFDLNNLKKEWEIEGITDLKIIENEAGNVDIWDILDDSRGEFVGYCSGKMSLVLFRDRLGGRNIYYSINCPRVFVSTDILWVLSNCGYEKKVNLSYITDEYLEFQVPFTNRTIYQDIHKVMPGEVVFIHTPAERGYDLPPEKRGFKLGEVTSEKYWIASDWLGEEKFDPLTLRDFIVDAVEWRKKIIGDKFTSNLSGGIDSSTITLLAKPFECFTGFYKEKEFSEIDFVDHVISCESWMRNVRVNIDEKIFHELLLNLPKIIPDPMGGLGVIPQAIVASYQSELGFGFDKRYQYAFTGEGGDEIFGGYPWNYTLYRQASHLKSLMLRDKYLVGWEPMINKMLHHAFVGFTATALGRGPSKVKQLEMINSTWDYTQSVENNLFLININIGLPAILTVDECVGRYTGIAPVSPLIDHHIVEYVASINPRERWKIPKFLLREAMKGILPEKIRNRYDKMGFPVPVEQWKWPMLPDLIHSFHNRNLIKNLPIDKSPNPIMSRWNWGIVNLEMICRMLEGE